MGRDFPLGLWIPLSSFFLVLRPRPSPRAMPGGRKIYDPHQYIKINKNNQTTSTKCQYHAAASKPK